MNEREYRVLRQKLNEEYRKNVEALDRVWRLAHPNGEALPGAESARPSEAASCPAGMRSREPGRAAPGNVTAAIRQVLDDIEGRFVWSDVRNRLNALGTDIEFKRVTINQVLRKLVAEEYLLVVEQGRGKRASVYQKASEVPDIRRDE